MPAGPAPGPSLGPTEQKSCRPVSHLGAGVTRVAFSHYRRSPGLPSAPSRAAAPAGAPPLGAQPPHTLLGPSPTQRLSTPPQDRHLLPGQALETALPAAGWAQTLSQGEGLPHRGPPEGPASLVLCFGAWGSASHGPPGPSLHGGLLSSPQQGKDCRVQREQAEEKTITSQE